MNLRTASWTFTSTIRLSQAPNDPGPRSSKSASRRKATIRAKARFGADRRAGAMMVEWWKVALGLRFDGDRKRLKFLKVRPWYAAQDLGLPDLEESDPDELYSLEALAGVTFEGIASRPVSLADVEDEYEGKVSYADGFAPPELDSGEEGEEQTETESDG